MEYEIIFNLNEIGEQIVGKPIRSFTVDIDESDWDNDINEKAHKLFPMENLYDNFDYRRSMADSQIGDIVEMHEPNGNIVIGEIMNVLTSEIIVGRLTEFGETDNWFLHQRYNKFGREIGPNEKNKWWLSPATSEEIEHFNVLKNYKKILDEIYYRMSDDIDNDPAGKKGINDLTADQLQRILDIFNETDDVLCL